MTAQTNNRHNVTISRTSLNVRFLIGLFIFGWLMTIVYDDLGKKGLGKLYFILLCIFVAAGINFNPMFALGAPVVYAIAWVHANVILSNH